MTHERICLVVIYARNKKNHPSKEFSGKGERRRRRRKVLRVGTQPWPDDCKQTNIAKNNSNQVVRCITKLIIT